MSYIYQKMPKNKNIFPALCRCLSKKSQRRTAAKINPNDGQYIILSAIIVPVGKNKLEIIRYGKINRATAATRLFIFFFQIPKASALIEKIKIARPKSAGAERQNALTDLI